MQKLPQSESEQPPSPKAPGAGESLESNIALLISLGHVNAWDYGYSFFLEAVKSLGTLHELAATVVACGIGKLFEETGKKTNVQHRRHPHKN